MGFAQKKILIKHGALIRMTRMLCECGIIFIFSALLTLRSAERGHVLGK